MNKEELKNGLRKAYTSILNDLEHIAEEDFYKRKNNKWSAAENLAHLTFSAKVFRKALKAPKLALAFRFGLNFKAAKDLNWIAKTYSEATFPAITGFEPKMKSENTAEFEKDEFVRLHEELISLIDNWSESQLRWLKLPQPILGKLSVGEMCLFFIHHLGHHQKAVRKVIT